MSLAERVLRSRLNGLDDQVPCDDVFAAAYPGIWGYLAFNKTEDGITKDRPELSFRMDRGDWLVTIRDSAMACSWPALGRTFQDALQALEMLLADPNAKPSYWRNGKVTVKHPTKPKEG
jgi:hypothetical protein